MTSPTSESTYPEARWRPADMADRASFLAAHPECRVTEEILARLEPEINHYASWIRRRSDELTCEDIRSEVIARLFECATYYREADAAGQPIFNFLEQATKYIVMHCAGHVSSELRRARNHQEITVSYDAPLELSGDDEGEEMLVTLADKSVSVDSERLEAQDLVNAVEERLRNDPALAADPSTRQVWDLIITDHDRTDIGALLGMRRQRVHERCAKLRSLIAEIDPAAAAGARRRDRSRVAIQSVQTA